MAQAHLASAPRITLLLNVSAAMPARARPVHRLPNAPKTPRLASSFKRGSSLYFWKASRNRRLEFQAISFSIRCEQSAKNSNGLDVWLGRLAMIGFATAITIEVATGKGVLENIGFTTPVPTLALAVTALVGVLTAFFIFQSASQD